MASDSETTIIQINKVAANNPVISDVGIDAGMRIYGPEEQAAMRGKIKMVNTPPDKLTIEDLEDILSHEYFWMAKRMQNRNIKALDRVVFEQLADTMRENERLLNAYKYGHQCLINVGFPNLAELMAVTAGRHNRNKESVDSTKT